MKEEEIKFKNIYRYDVYRYYDHYKESLIERLKRPDGLKYMRLFRKYNATCNKLLKAFYLIKIFSLQRKTFIQIPPRTKIGKGFYIGHNGRVIINPDAVLGNNVNVHTGVTIGQENRGRRKGCPVIGNEVWIGTNAVVVGKITIGNDVLIAPNSYVNFDVPDHSIVVGNPGKIVHRDNATEEYINSIV